MQQENQDFEPELKFIEKMKITQYLRELSSKRIDNNNADFRSHGVFGKVIPGGKIKLMKDIEEEYSDIKSLLGISIIKSYLLKLYVQFID